MYINWKVSNLIFQFLPIAMLVLSHSILYTLLLIHVLWLYLVMRKKSNLEEKNTFSWAENNTHTRSEGDKHTLAQEIIFFPGWKSSSSTSIFCHLSNLSRKCKIFHYMFYKYKLCLSLVNMFFNKQGFGEYHCASPTVIREKKTVPMTINS